MSDVELEQEMDYILGLMMNIILPEIWTTAKDLLSSQKNF
jgi:hypothetical protein